MPTSDEVVAKQIADIVRTMSSQITSLGDGLQIVQNGKTFKIPFNQVAVTTQTTQITKK